jgi:hypothetical protein
LAGAAGLFGDANNWEDLAHGSSPGVPSAGNDAVVFQTVTLTGSGSFDELTVYGDLTLPGVTFTGGGIGSSGDIAISGSHISAGVGGNAVSITDSTTTGGVSGSNITIVDSAITGGDVNGGWGEGHARHGGRQPERRRRHDARRQWGRHGSG